MTQEDKNLLLKDLCARLPYEVKAQVYNHWRDEVQDETITIENLHQLIETFSIGDIKPYLFPLSSMTEEQEKEFNDLYYRYHESAFIFNERFSYDKWNLKDIGFYPYYLQDWFNKNNFDYRGLIPMELAIDATGKNVY